MNFDIAVTNHKRATTTLVRLIGIIDWAWPDFGVFNSRLADIGDNTRANILAETHF